MGRADGSIHRVLTSGQAMWFAATYGDPQMRGGGSNVPAWTADGRILFPRRTEGAKVAWEYQSGRPDVDHFNRDFKPELRMAARKSVCSIRATRASSRLRTRIRRYGILACQSADGRRIVFCRAATGAARAVWIMDSDGQNPRLITRGLEERGADHPRWLPQSK